MKKLLLFLASIIFALGLTSCSKDKFADKINPDANPEVTKEEFVNFTLDDKKCIITCEATVEAETKVSENVTLWNLPEENFYYVESSTEQKYYTKSAIDSDTYYVYNVKDGKMTNAIASLYGDDIFDSANLDETIYDVLEFKDGFYSYSEEANGTKVSATYRFEDKKLTICNLAMSANGYSMEITLYVDYTDFTLTKPSFVGSYVPEGIYLNKTFSILDNILEYVTLDCDFKMSYGETVEAVEYKIIRENNNYKEEIYMEGENPVIYYYHRVNDTFSLYSKVGDNWIVSEDEYSKPTLYRILDALSTSGLEYASNTNKYVLKTDNNYSLDESITFENAEFQIQNGLITSFTIKGTFDGSNFEVTCSSISYEEVSVVLPQ